MNTIKNNVLINRFIWLKNSIVNRLVNCIHDLTFAKHMLIFFTSLWKISLFKFVKITFVCYFFSQAIAAWYFKETCQFLYFWYRILTTKYGVMLDYKVIDQIPSINATYFSLILDINLLLKVLNIPGRIHSFKGTNIVGNPWSHTLRSCERPLVSENEEQIAVNM